MSDEQVKLTKTVKKGGCAAKVAASVLRGILSQVKFPTRRSEILVDGRTFDDAAVISITDDLAVVETLDFFTPIVNDPKTFGRVAAANALSDVYAMGGTPRTALAILAFPIAEMPEATIVDVLTGACEALQEGGVSLVGGHSIDDETLKFGLSVMGTVSPKEIWTNAQARVGDDLVLTKAIGTGTLTAGLKRDFYSELDIKDALNSMGQLNRILDFLGPNIADHIHSATDITGFGLSGHCYQMASASGVSFDIRARAIPLFERTLESLRNENLTKAHRTNREYTESGILVDSGLSPEEKLLLHDPQTSGGLLLSVDPRYSSEMIHQLQREFPKASVIGKVISREALSVKFS